MRTVPEVFIIESLTWEDERHNRFEGKIISQVLALSGKQCEYYYVRTEKELRHVLRLFTQSQYRYLHLSCHGSTRTMYTTMDEIPLRSLEAILGSRIDNRRLFLSACQMACNSLARMLMPRGCTSILGPKGRIDFNDAAIFWSSLYKLMFEEESAAMRHSVLRQKAEALAQLHCLSLNYFGRNKDEPGCFTFHKINYP